MFLLDLHQKVSQVFVKVNIFVTMSTVHGGDALFNPKYPCDEAPHMCSTCMSLASLYAHVFSEPCHNGLRWRDFYGCLPSNLQYVLMWSRTCEETKAMGEIELLCWPYSVQWFGKVRKCTMNKEKCIPIHCNTKLHKWLSWQTKCPDMHKSV